MQSRTAAIPCYLIGFMFLAMALLVGEMAKENMPLTPTPYEQLTMLPVYIQSVEYKEKRCGGPSRGNLSRKSYVCDKYHELKAIHQTEKHLYTLRLIGIGQLVYHPKQHWISRSHINSLTNRKVNVWVNKNNPRLIYQATLIFNPLPRANMQYEEWLLYQALMPGKTDNERFLVYYKNTLQQLLQKKYPISRYLPIWLAALVFTALGGACFWLPYQQWQKDRPRPFPAENPFR